MLVINLDVDGNIAVLSVVSCRDLNDLAAENLNACHSLALGKSKCHGKSLSYGKVIGRSLNLDLICLLEGLGTAGECTCYGNNGIGIGKSDNKLAVCNCCNSLIVGSPCNGNILIGSALNGKLNLGSLGEASGNSCVGCLELCLFLIRLLRKSDVCESICCYRGKIECTVVNADNTGSICKPAGMFGVALDECCAVSDDGAYGRRNTDV